MRVPGRGWDPVLPKAYLQARYSYAFVERVLGIAPNRSNTEFELGYFLTPRFSLLGLGQWTYTHSGVDFVWPLFRAGLVGDQWIHHDQIGKSSLLDLGGGFAYAVTPSWQVFFSAARSVEGRNGHLHAAVVTLGVGRSFGGRSAEDGISLLGSGGESGPAPSKAFVCTCARTN